MYGIQRGRCWRLTIILAGVVIAGVLPDCALWPFSSDKTGQEAPVPASKTLIWKSAFIPIIYSDRVVELDPRTGKERTIPDEDLIVEDGKVWGRYLRLGNDVKYAMFYNNHLCVPRLTADIETIGDTSQPVRSFAIPEQKYDDCKEEAMKKAAKRIQQQQLEFKEFDLENLKRAQPK